MTDNGTNATRSIADATLFALQQSGKAVLHSPQRLLGYLIDTAPESQSLTVLERNMDEDLLGPLADAVCGSEPPTMGGIRHAAARMEDLLVNGRAVAPQPAHQAVDELCRGTARYLAERSGVAQRPAPESEPVAAPAPAPTPTTPAQARPHTVTVTPSARGRAPESPASQPVAPSATPKAPVQTAPKQNAGSTAKSKQTAASAQPLKKKGYKVTLAIVVALVAAYIALGLIASGIQRNRMTISFDDGDATGSTGDIEAWRDSEVSLPSCGYTLSGYSFAGWELDGKTYQPGDTISPNDSVTLTAVWAAEITFDGNGASSGKFDRILALPGETITLPDLECERIGYHPLGWDNDGELHAAGDEVTVDGPVTYRISWGPCVSFDGNGAEEGSVEDMLVQPGETITLPKISFKRGKHRANGWVAGGKLYKAGDEVTIDSPVTFGVSWGPRVTFDGNGADGGETGKLYADFEGNVTAPKCGFTYADHVFKGWATSKDGRAQYDPGETFSNSEPTTLYAVWELDPDIMSKVSVEGVGYDWNNGGHSTMLYVTNNSSTPLKLRASFRFLDASGNELASNYNEKQCVAPGETTLLFQNCSKSGFSTCDYSVTAEEVASGSAPLYGNVSVDEASVEMGKIVVRLTNNSSKTAFVESLFFYGKSNNGGRWLHPEYPGESIAPGESLDVDIVSTSVPPEAARFDLYYTRQYYLDGYLE